MKTPNKNINLLLMLLTATIVAQAQQIKFTVGSEALRSFNYSDAYWGVGGSAQADFWIKERLWLGVHGGYAHFTKTNTHTESSSSPHYNAFSALSVVKYPLPVIAGLYGQDMFGYTFVTHVSFENTGAKANGGFTYYFALGYEFGKHLDLSAKVGRARLNKKNNSVNTNEHNLGLRLAYRF